MDEDREMQLGHDLSNETRVEVMPWGESIIRCYHHNFFFQISFILIPFKWRWRNVVMMQSLQKNSHCSSIVRTTTIHQSIDLFLLPFSQVYPKPCKTLYKGFFSSIPIQSELFIFFFSLCFFLLHPYWLSSSQLLSHNLLFLKSFQLFI